MCYHAHMSIILEQAFTSLRTLPADMQDELGQKLLTYVTQWRELKAGIDQGTAELARGEGVDITDTADVLKGIRNKHA